MSSLLMLGLIGTLGFLSQWLAWRLKLPAILFLLVIGIVLGPATQVFDPDALFGELLFPFVSLAVAVILFEGSLTLKRSELDDIGSTVRNMVTIGIVVNGCITAVATHYLTGLSWQLSALFGAIMVVTGPTVVMPMLRAIRPNNRISRVLRWEGIIIDPIGALLAVIVFELIVSSQHAADGHSGNILFVFFATVGTGFITGVIAAQTLGVLLRREWLPDYLQNYAALAFVTLTFALSDALMHESGLVAVTVMGIWLVNMKDVRIRSILHFKENLTTIFVSVLFIILAARIDFAELQQLGWSALGVFLVMQFLARPAKVLASTVGAGFTLREKTLIAWIGPRGIVAAAVSAVFALRLEQAGLAEARLLVPLAFSVIIGTVLVQGLSSRPLATWLDVLEDNTDGYLINAANPVSILIAKALDDCGIRSVVCDSNWDAIASARMAGLTTYYGDPISHRADIYLNINGLGGALGLSRDEDKNRSALLRYRDEFGTKNLFALANRKQTEKQGTHYVGHVLFGNQISYGVLAGMVNRGASVKKTSITETFSYQDWSSNQQSNNTLILFYISEKGKLIWSVEGDSIDVKAGWTIVQLADQKPDDR